MTARSVKSKRNRILARIVLRVVLVGFVVAMAYRPASESHPWTDHVVRSVPTRERVVALTFDDGPDPVFTPQILDQLDRYAVKATFFMIGQHMEKHPQIAREVVRRGHAIGNHTYSHARGIGAASVPGVVRELDQCREIIEQTTGHRTHLFRPPRGLVNETVIAIASDRGYRTIMWTVCADNRQAPTPQLMAQRVLQRIRPGAIILLHLGTFKSRWKDVEATPMIIEQLRERGYRFVTVPELLEIGSGRPAGTADG